jgi:hypothetical protein
VWRRKIRAAQSDAAGRAKQMRFLAARGFADGCDPPHGGWLTDEEEPERLVSTEQSNQLPAHVLIACALRTSESHA